MAHVGKEGGLQLVGSLCFFFGNEEFLLHPFHFGDVPFDAQQDRGEVFALDAHFPFVEDDGFAVLVVLLGDPMLFDAGFGYLHVLLSLFLCDVKGVEVEVVFAQRFLHGDVPVVRFTITV